MKITDEMVQAGLAAYYEADGLHIYDTVQSIITAAIPHLQPVDVPDVPELMRYDLACDFDGKHHPDIIEVELGDYVRYDQAAEMIGGLEGALKNERELSAKKSEQIRHWRNTWHEENDKLAQIKAQKPVDQTPEIERLRSATTHRMD